MPHNDISSPRKNDSLNTLLKRDVMQEVSVLLPPDTMKQEMLEIPNTTTCDVNAKDMILTTYAGQRLKDKDSVREIPKIRRLHQACCVGHCRG